VVGGQRSAEFLTPQNDDKGNQKFHAAQTFHDLEKDGHCFYVLLTYLLH
jgi:hypothetical protein